LTAPTKSSGILDMDPYWKSTLGNAHPAKDVEVHPMIQRTRDAFTSFNWLTPLPNVADDTQEHMQRQFDRRESESAVASGE